MYVRHVAAELAAAEPEPACSLAVMLPANRDGPDALPVRVPAARLPGTYMAAVAAIVSPALLFLIPFDLPLSALGLCARPAVKGAYAARSIPPFVRLGGRLSHVDTYCRARRLGRERDWNAG
ncbi:hypothetical protein CDD83_4211 [Cordyceps sp. RAO-2017]|nr:hypothetical protein CDD83_4211 [Cordyceps sp. RAO-2017]